MSGSSGHDKRSYAMKSPNGNDIIQFLENIQIEKGDITPEGSTVQVLYRPYPLHGEVIDND
jgi:hypothetical protein